MLIDKDNYLICKENDCFKAAVFSTVGGRDDQQDSAGYEIDVNGGVFVVCDGMGGHKGGKTASELTVNILLEQFDSSNADDDVNDLLLNGAELADKEVSELSDEDGNLLNGGSTAAIIVLRGKKLYWLSVGDSRIYIYRSGELVRITNDHTYEVALQENMKAGLITQDFFNQQIDKGDALISFIGVGGMPLIDRSINPITLQTEDVVLIMTDGLYKNIPDHIIKRYIENFRNPMDSLSALEKKVEKMAFENEISRDNMTVALIRIK